MEVDAATEAVVDRSNQTNISVVIHPLVLLNVSEHWTRLKLIHNSLSTVAFGVLLGKQNGRDVEMHNTFEIVVDDNLAIDLDYLVDRAEKVKLLYKGLDIIGWYTNGKSLSEENKMFHFQFTEKYECSYILILDPLDKTCERLPFRLYESAVDNLSLVYFKQVAFKVGNDPIESIGVDLLARFADVAKSSPETVISDANASSDVPSTSNALPPSSSIKTKDVSGTAETLLENYQAVQMLSNRLNLLRDYVDAVFRGELPINHTRMREIRTLLVRLPHALSADGPFGDNPNHTIDDLEDRAALTRQATDVCLSSVLAGLTRTLQGLHAWLCKEKLVALSQDAPVKASGFSHRGKCFRPAKVSADALEDDMMNS